MTTLAGAALQRRLERREFTDLFVEELGWDRLRGAAEERFQIDGQAVRLEGLAQKRDVPLYLHRGLAGRNARRRIERELSRRQLEHLLVFLDEGTGAQVWQWVKREAGRPDRVREHSWRPGEPIEALRQKLDALQFTLEEEEAGRIEVTAVTNRLKRAFDADKVTKRFYKAFEDQHKAIQKFLKGLPEEQRSWYASVTLNRLMFVWFIQKKGFVAGDTDYLATKLAESRQRGKDLFFRGLLGPLFFRGFALPKAERTGADRALLGDVPYLNGGLFQEHQIEREHGAAIDLPDKAFADLFDFFGGWTWHLDERDADAQRGAQASEINPDVLGYIFEKYVNQKQMGAYYTKEDITEYICANTLLPRLLDKVKALVPVAFRGDGSVWRLLADDPDRYIWPSVRHGLHKALPAAVAAGVEDVAARKGVWDKPATADLGLPTETWREVVHRRDRCEALRARLAAGEIAGPDAMVTANLDIHRFVQDAIAAASEDQLKSWWEALTGLTVLDPACGSGAFLFAALNLLEPLYTQLFDAMGTAVADARAGATPERPFDKRRWKPLTDVLGEAERHANPAYFVLRQIALNNLYGVDIMEEAAEICKLRLFLKLVAQLDDAAQIEPLPDLDFNIRSGNSLVGFASREQLDAAVGGQLDFEGAADRIEEEAEQAALCFRRFKDRQVVADPDTCELRETKAELERRLAEVADQANRWLATRYGKSPDKPKVYAGWLRSHKPFNWFTEFYDVMHGGGFDALIGNPPFLEATEVDYSLEGYVTGDSRSVHGVFVERFASLAKDDGSLGVVLPMSVVSTQRMTSVQKELEDGATAVYANFSWRPATLFEAVNRAITIVIALKDRDQAAFSTGYMRWTADSRDHLIKRVTPTQVSSNREGWAVPKLSRQIETDILTRIEQQGVELGRFLSGRANPIFYKSTGGLYWKVFTDFPPRFLVNGKRSTSSRQQSLYVSDSKQRSAIVGMLNSSFFWWWYTLTSNLRDLNPSDLRGFRIPPPAPSDSELSDLGKELMRHYDANSVMMTRQQRTTGKTEVQSFKVKLSKAIIDQIDDRMVSLFGLGAEHAEFIKSYDVGWRLSIFGGDAEEGEAEAA